MISPESIAKIKLLFDDWMELLDNRQQLNNQIKSLIEEASVVADAKKTIVRKTFNYLKKKHESGDDEIGEIANIMIQLE